MCMGVGSKMVVSVVAFLRKLMHHTSDESRIVYTTARAEETRNAPCPLLAAEEIHIAYVWEIGRGLHRHPSTPVSRAGCNLLRKTSLYIESFGVWGRAPETNTG